MAKLVLTFAAVLALMASTAHGQKEVILVGGDDDNLTNSSLDVDIDNGKGQGGDDSNGGKGGETNETAAKTTVEFQVALDVAGKSIEDLRSSEPFMGALKSVGAKMANTSQDAVTVSLSGARRLALRAARRLAAVSADFVVEVADGADASALAASITSQGSIESVTTLLDEALTTAGIDGEFNTTVTSAATTPVTNDPNNNNQNNENGNQNNQNPPSEETSKAAGGFGTMSLLVASAAAVFSAIA